MSTVSLPVPPAFPQMPTDRDLPYSDGVPMDSPWHRDCMALLIDSLEQHWQGRKDFFVGGDMFLYFSPEHDFNKDFRGPAFFLVKGVDHDKKRHSYVAWQENSRLPCAIVELGSESTLKIDRGEKKRLYGNVLGAAEYFVYDPVEPRLEGWRLSNGSGYVAIEPACESRMWSQELVLYVGPWRGPFRGSTDRWLRFFDREGQLVPTFAEAEASARAVAEIKARTAEAEARAARTQVERLQREIELLRRPQQQPSAR